MKQSLKKNETNLKTLIEKELEQSKLVLRKKHKLEFNDLKLLDLQSIADNKDQATIRSDSLNLEQKIFIENYLNKNINTPTKADIIKIP